MAGGKPLQTRLRISCWPSIYAAWRAQHLRRLARAELKTCTKKSPSPRGGRVGMGVRQICKATKPSNDAAWRAQYFRRLARPVLIPLGEPSIYAAWRVPNSNLARKKALLPVGEGLGWGLDKSAKRQNPATTPLGGPSNYTAWRVPNSNLARKKPFFSWGEGLGWGLDKSAKRQNPVTTPLGVSRCRQTAFPRYGTQRAKSSGKRILPQSSVSPTRILRR